MENKQVWIREGEDKGKEGARKQRKSTSRVVVE